MFAPERSDCCDKEMLVLKTRVKRVATMELGTFSAHETILHCPCSETARGSKELHSLVPHRCQFGFNVIVHVGQALFLRGCSEREVQQELLENNIQTSLNEVGYLGKKFIAYLAIAHSQNQEPIRKLLQEQGGYILHLDATCEGDSPMLMSGLDELSNLVLDNIKLPSEKAASIAPFLERIRTALGNPLAVVSDMSTGIASAFREVFPTVPHFICHFHFLRDIGKDLLGADYDSLRRSLKSFAVRKKLRELAKKCAAEIEKNSLYKKAFEQYLEEHSDGKPTVSLPPPVLAYTLILWILNAKKTAQGNGFPFDRPLLTLYQRLTGVGEMFKKRTTLHCKHRCLKSLRDIIQPALRDETFQRVTARLQERVVVFDQLRTAMRIATPDSKNSLNDDGEKNGKLISLTPIKTALTTFRNDPTIVQRATSQLAYKKMLKQIDISWNKLFADPIKIKAPNGHKLIYPQRTNNILERFFRSLKRSLRRKTGNHSLNRTLKALLADTPLIQNLKNEKYLSLIINGKASLEERFADIDSQLVSNFLSQQNKASDFQISPNFRKILAVPDLPQKLLVNTHS